jgi:hypothetical protein
MMLYKPYLFVRRLVVISHTGSVAYDEVFHHGVNIIRGRNGSGKSTIANFLFYGLGGDFSNWTTEANKCNIIYIEVEINEAILTLKRTVSSSPRQPMNIFYGDYETAMKSNYEGWKVFPYQQTDNKESFSHIIFNALGFPEVRTENDNNITMHQILRLLYIDQESPTQNLYRFERFDPPLMKQAISELLLGVYDDSLYNDRLNLRAAKKENEEKQKQFDGISKVFGSTGTETNITKVQEEIENAQKEINLIQTELISLREKAVVKRRKTTPLKIEKLQNELTPAKIEIHKIQVEIKTLEFEIFDSKQFVESLQKRIDSLDNSVLTRQVLGELPLTNCPQCLSPLEKASQEGVCFLCKQPLIEEAEKTQAKRLRQELLLQIKESKKLLEKNEGRLVELTGRYSPLIAKARNIQQEIDLEEKESKSTRDEEFDALLVKKGGIENKIIFLSKQSKTTEMLELLRKDLQELSKTIERLEQSIKLKINKQATNFQTGMSKIKEFAKELLRKDLDRQVEFKTGQSIEIDFAKDSFTLDGGNNFSASSNTYFKNAVRYAVFFASLELNYFRFPRFILCDNMEDKGMEQIRTQHFQKTITELSNSSKTEHQIIFTTSMVEPTLNNTPLCVGIEYDENNRTLRV